MGLVDGQQVDVAAGHGVEKAAGAEAFRRAVDDSRSAVANPGERLAVRRRGQARGDHDDRMTRRGHPKALVGHQRDQRADHHAQLRGGKARELVAKALSSARRHDDQRVAAVERRLDRLALAGPEGLVAQVRQERLRVWRPLVIARLGAWPVESLEPLQRKGCLRLLGLGHPPSLGAPPARVPTGVWLDRPSVAA